LTVRTEHGFIATAAAGRVSAILSRPRTAQVLYVLAHGAGAGMRHPFMEEMASRLASREVATLRFQFPYMEVGRRGPSLPAVLVETVRSAVAEATRLEPELPLIAGGKSMGGRMTSMAGAAQPLPGVVGLAFLGFPLHAAGRPSVDRAAHLGDVGLPMLFLQGTRDKLCALDLLGPVVGALRPPATLHVVDEADHGFHVPRRSGRSDDEVLDELANVLSDWAREQALTAQ